MTSEVAQQLTVIASAFVLTFALVGLTRLSPLAAGCAVPVIPAIGMAIWLSTRPMLSSTDSAAITTIAFFAAMGSVPAALLAGLWTKKLK